MENQAERQLLTKQLDESVGAAGCGAGGNCTCKEAEDTAFALRLPEVGCFHRAVLDSLALHIAVLDKTGAIIAVNDCWRRYAEQNGQIYYACTGVSDHDLNVCRCALGENDHTAQEVIRGVQGVLSGQLPSFQKEYACYFPDETHWFHMLVNPIVVRGSRGAVVSHLDITERVRAEMEGERLLEELREQGEQMRLLNRRLRELARQVLRVQEEERYRLSRVLHDEAGQILTVLKYRLELLQAGLAQQGAVLSAEHEQHLRAATMLCGSALEHMRTLAHELRPSALDDLGLVPAMSALCEEFNAQERFEIDFHYVRFTPLSKQADLAFYRCLQEALTNALKHSQATRVQVRLEEVAGSLTLTVKDNGCGFILGHCFERTDRLGLLGMRERLEAAGGCLEVRSAPGEGATVIACVPAPP